MVDSNPETKPWEEHPGKYDEDGFYILEEGGFYDPLGVRFGADGLDEHGGRYDEQGFYVAGYPLRHSKEGEQLHPAKKAEIEAKEGAYDEDGFYILGDGAFYDPHGFYFDSDGVDAAGGSYDKDGYYISPVEYVQDYGDEDEAYLHDDNLERQAILSEHIVPGQAHARNLLSAKPDGPLLIKVANIPKETLKSE